MVFMGFSWPGVCWRGRGADNEYVWFVVPSGAVPNHLGMTFQNRVGLFALHFRFLSE